MSSEPRFEPSPAIRYLRLAETVLLIVLFAAVALFPLLQIVLRTFFATGLLWADSFLRQAVLWLSLLGAARATLDEKHIRIDLLPRFLPPNSARVVAIVTTVFSFVVALVLSYASVLFVYYERQTGGLGVGRIPAWWLQLVFPLGFGLMALRFAVLAWGRWRGAAGDGSRGAI